MEVTLEFTDLEILEVDDIKHTLTMKMHLGVHWTEPRLVCPQNNIELGKVPLDLQFLDHLWLPDLDIYNIKLIQDFKVLKKLAGIMIKMLHSHLNIYTKVNITLKQSYSNLRYTLVLLHIYLFRIMGIQRNYTVLFSIIAFNNLLQNGV